MEHSRTTDLVLELLAACPARPLVIALDGPGAAGTSTLGANLGLRLAGSVVEGDDFYRDMPEEQRWSLTPAQGVEEYFDWQRLRYEVLEPLRAGRTARYPQAWRALMKVLRRLGVGTRLAFSFAAVGLALIALAATGVIGYAIQAKSAASLAQATTLSHAAMQAKFRTADFAGWQTGYAFDYTRGMKDADVDTLWQRASFLASTEAFSQDLDLIASLHPTPKETALLADARTEFTAFLGVDKRIIAGYRTHTTAGTLTSNALASGESLVHFGKLADDTSMIADSVLARANATTASMRAAIATGQRIMVIAGALGVLFALALAVVVTASITRLEVAVQARTNALEVANQELEELVREVTQLAMHDALTGLSNRLLFADRAAQVLAAAGRDGATPVVLMLDLDRFKEVNDTIGHHHGDLLLQQVAQRMSGLLRESETLARFGGDEFVVLLTDGGAEAGADVARRIASALEAPFRLGEASVWVEASIGVAAVSANEEPSLEELLRQADIAMYKAKADRSGFAHFAACNDDGTPDRLKLIGELHQGLDCEELVLHYQPKIALQDGGLLGVEALVRWQHPTRGLLLPGEFIALAEGSTLIHRLTTQVLDIALRFTRTWLDRGLRLPVAVNISARSLFDPDFPTIVADRLAQAGVSPDLLTIEITEGTVMAYPDLALDILKKLRGMGVHLSVDDYGTGYSTMAYLKNLPVDELKIDRAFITNLATDHADAVIVKSAMDLGHNLGLSIVAEGVEDEDTLQALKVLGVDVAQGFHLGRPMPENLLQTWIAHHGDPPSAQNQDRVPAMDANHQTTVGSAGQQTTGLA